MQELVSARRSLSCLRCGCYDRRCQGGRILSLFERHIFVCENVRSAGHPRGCCADKGSREIRARFKQLIHAASLDGRVRANQSGCLDQCERGVTVVVYPEAVWYGGVTLADVDEIFQRHVVQGEVVERLLLGRLDDGNA